ncbi:MAG: hypothetical protein PWP56_1293 [Acetobacterium sp.]|jgi:hypothetical protein|nr:hypothetical protein [Acetobacterium sp.]
MKRRDLIKKLEKLVLSLIVMAGSMMFAGEVKI